MTMYLVFLFEITICKEQTTERELRTKKKFLKLSLISILCFKNKIRKINF